MDCLRDLRSALLICGVALAAVPAHAQTPNMNNPGGPVVGMAHPRPPMPVPPPGVPGASNDNTGSSAPPAPSASSMSPNAALFDAINRGDLAEARDAIARGAQVDARNVLGMTPLEEAIDLNRNDIAFLLLSIVHEHSAAAASANSALSLNVPPAPAAVPTAPSSAGSPLNGSAGSVQDILLANQPPARPLPASAKPGAPRLPDPLAVEGSASPNPAVGFLGFGPRAGGATQN